MTWLSIALILVFAATAAFVARELWLIRKADRVLTEWRELVDQLDDAIGTDRFGPLIEQCHEKQVRLEALYARSLIARAVKQEEVPDGD